MWQCSVVFVYIYQNRAADFIATFLTGLFCPSSEFGGTPTTSIIRNTSTTHHITNNINFAIPDDDNTKNSVAKIDPGYDTEKSTDYGYSNKSVNVDTNVRSDSAVAKSMLVDDAAAKAAISPDDVDGKTRSLSPKAVVGKLGVSDRVEAKLTAAESVGKVVADMTTGANGSATLSERVKVGRGRWRHSASDCLACVRTRPPSSHELREAFFAGT